MFKKNSGPKQVSLLDPYNHYPKYIQKALEKSWAVPFYRDIFCNINEERFAVLYSDKFSRPNVPVNILVGLLMLKELNGWTDEEALGAMYFDYRVQYALGITDLEKERLCINTLGNFRNRLYNYEEDLMQEEVRSLSQHLAEITKMDASLARQDSMMISANCKRMSRVELIYTVNYKVIKLLTKQELEIPESCRHYLKEEDKTDHIYRLKQKNVKEKIRQLLQESVEIFQAAPKELHSTDELQNLARLLPEQMHHTGKNLIPKEDEEISADSLQNPSEPEATYRNKGGKKHIGYVLNLVEARDEEKDLGLILHHEECPNTVSDVELGKRSLDKLSGVKELVSDGAFYSAETVTTAKSKGITPHFSALNGRKSSAETVAGFEINPETNKIISCPAGIKPTASSLTQGVYKAKFSKNDCNSCSLRASCPIKQLKKFNTVRFTEKKYQADIQRAEIGTKEHKAFADFRAGVEGVPSVLRRAYNIDHIPVRGLKKSKLWVSCKVMAYNFRNFWNYCRKQGGGKSHLSNAADFLCWISNLFMQEEPVAC